MVPEGSIIVRCPNNFQDICFWKVYATSFSTPIVFFFFFILHGGQLLCQQKTSQLCAVILQVCVNGQRDSIQQQSWIPPKAELYRQPIGCFINSFFVAELYRQPRHSPCCCSCHWLSGEDASTEEWTRGLGCSMILKDQKSDLVGWQQTINKLHNRRSNTSSPKIMLKNHPWSKPSNFLRNEEVRCQESTTYMVHYNRGILITCNTFFKVQHIVYLFRT